MRSIARALCPAALALALALAACGGTSTPTPTPAPTATPTVAPTPTIPPTVTPIPARPGAASGTASPASAATPGGTANPAAVTSAFANLQKLDSYHLEIVATGVGSLIPLGISNNLTYSIDFNKGNQHIVIDDGSGTKQEGYKVNDKFYLVNGTQVTDATSFPLIFTLPDLLYSNLTAPGAVTFTAAGNEQVNGRAATKYNGTGQLSKLASNPLLAAALGTAAGDISGPIWVDAQGSFLVSADLMVNVTAPQAGVVRVKMDTTKVGQVGPITAPK